MAKLVRKTLLQFGSTVNPASEIGQFGSYASPIYSNDPTVIQAGTAWPRAWFAETINTNRPFIQDINAVDFVFGYMLSYLFQMGIAEYDSGTTYYLNSVCQIAGQLYVSLQDNNTGNAPASSPTYWQAGLPGSEVSGVIKPYAGVAAPAGYLLCQGQAVSRTTYAALFAVCGVAFGAGDGSTTFNVPNLQGRVPVGQLTGDSNFGTIGGIGGEKTHQLTVSEIPSLIVAIQSYGGGLNGGGSWNITGNTENGPTGIQNFPTSGGGQPHNNLQPYVTLNYIIKT